MSHFAPLLSATADVLKDPDVLSKLVFPGYGSPKIDGIRGTPRNRVMVSRKLLPLPRQHVQDEFGHLEHYDGEVTVANWMSPDIYNRTQSYVMSKKDRPREDIFYHVFDWTEDSWAQRPFIERMEHARAQVASCGLDNVLFVEQRLLNNLEEFLAFEEEMLALGYEGIMYRSIDGAYVASTGRENRSTFNAGILIKLKRCQDDEGIVVGFIEELHNSNEALKDALGKTKRSSAKAGMVPAGTLGKFKVLFEGRVEEVSCGAFKHPERQYIFDHQDEFLNGCLKVRHFPHGAKDKWRQARALGWRTAEDL